MKNGFWSLLSKPQEGEDFFLPDLCSSVAVFTLVVLAELMVLVWVLAQPAAEGFDWLQLALASLFVQWIVLLSAGLLCRLRPWMQARPLGLAIACCYAVVVGLTRSEERRVGKECRGRWGAGAGKREVVVA